MRFTALAVLLAAASCGGDSIAINGTVVDSRGYPVRYDSVEIWPAGTTTPLTVELDANGGFAGTGIKAPYNIVVPYDPLFPIIYAGLTTSTPHIVLSAPVNRGSSTEVLILSPEIEVPFEQDAETHVAISTPTANDSTFGDGGYRMPIWFDGAIGETATVDVLNLALTAEDAFFQYDDLVSFGTKTFVLSEPPAGEYAQVEVSTMTPIPKQVATVTATRADTGGPIDGMLVVWHPSAAGFYDVGFVSAKAASTDVNVTNATPMSLVLESKVDDFSFVTLTKTITSSDTSIALNVTQPAPLALGSSDPKSNADDATTLEVVQEAGAVYLFVVYGSTENDGYSGPIAAILTTSPSVALGELSRHGTQFEPGSRHMWKAVAYNGAGDVAPADYLLERTQYGTDNVTVRPSVFGSFTMKN